MTTDSDSVQQRQGDSGVGPSSSVRGVIARLLMVPYAMLVVFAVVAAAVVVFSQFFPHFSVLGTSPESWAGRAMNSIANDMVSANPDNELSRQYVEANPNRSLSYDGAEGAYVVMGSISGLFRLLWWVFSKYAIVCVVPFVVLLFRHWNRPVRGYLDCLVWPARMWTKLVAGKVGKLFLIGTGIIILVNVAGGVAMGLALLMAHILTGSGVGVLSGLTWVMAGPIRVLHWGNQFGSGIRGVTGGGMVDPVMWLLAFFMIVGIVLLVPGLAALLADVVCWGVLTLPVTLPILGYMSAHRMIGDPHTVLWGFVETWVLWWLAASIIASVVLCAIPYFAGLVLSAGDVGAAAAAASAEDQPDEGSGN